MEKKKSHKVQANVEEYTLFVIEGLINIVGTSKADVVGHILKSWISENSELLNKWNLSVNHWMAAKKK